MRSLNTILLLLVLTRKIDTHQIRRNQTHKTHMKKQPIIRQGDVVLVPIEKLPSDLQKKPRDKGRIVLAYGEVTGHCHAIKSKNVEAWVDGAGVTMLEVKKAMALLEHDEHGTAEIPAGRYIARIKRTYSRGEIRNVQD